MSLHPTPPEPGVVIVADTSTPSHIATNAGAFVICGRTNPGMIFQNVDEVSEEVHPELTLQLPRKALISIFVMVGP